MHNLVNILIINQYASTPGNGIGGRHFYLAQNLARMGHRVTIVAGGWHHLLMDDAVSGNETELIEERFTFVRIGLPRYSGAHSLRRILNWFLFAFKSLSILKQLRKLGIEAPDHVIYSSPSPIGSLSAYVIAKRAGATFIFEVRDIWPLSLQVMGSFSKFNPLLILMKGIEIASYRLSNLVISNLEGFKDYLTANRYRHSGVSWIPNGVEQVDSEIRTSIVKTGMFTVGYAGSLGLANSMDVLIKAAHLLNQRPEIRFVIVGDGPVKGALEDMCSDLKLTNVEFRSPIPKSEVPLLLSEFDLCFLSWRDSPLYAYGIAANKIFDYMAAGKPILQCYGGKYDPVTRHGAGVTVPPGDPIALAEAIEQLWSASPEELQKLSANSYRAACDYFAYPNIARSLEAALLQLK